MYVFLIRGLSLPRNNCRSVLKERSILYLQSVCSDRRGPELLGMMLMPLSRFAARDVSFDWTDISLHVYLSACHSIPSLVRYEMQSPFVLPCDRPARDVARHSCTPLPCLQPFLAYAPLARGLSYVRRSKGHTNVHKFVYSRRLERLGPDSERLYLAVSALLVRFPVAFHPPLRTLLPRHLMTLISLLGPLLKPLSRKC